MGKSKKCRNDQKTRIVETGFSVVLGSPVRLDDHKGCIAEKALNHGRLGIVVSIGGGVGQVGGRSVDVPWRTAQLEVGAVRCRCREGFAVGGAREAI